MRHAARPGVLGWNLPPHLSRPRLNCLMKNLICVLVVLGLSSSDDIPLIDLVVYGKRLKTPWHFQAQQFFSIRGGGNAEHPAAGLQAIEILDTILRTQRCGNTVEGRNTSERKQSEASEIVRSLKTSASNPSAENLRPGEVRIRQAAILDVVDMQRINLVCLPENYQVQYFWYHLMQWPHLIYVAEAECGGVMRVVGYVLAKMDDDESDARLLSAAPSGHITSIAVMRTHRNRRVAKRLMLRAMQRMVDQYHASRCSLHARSRNRAALVLYAQSLGFNVERVEERYYADGEDALLMSRSLVGWTPPVVADPRITQP